MAKQSKVAQYDADKTATQRARQEELLKKNFLGIANYDDGLSAEEVKYLYAQNESFRTVVDTIDGFRKLTEEQQAQFFSEAKEEIRITLADDGYVPSQTQTLAPSLGEAEEESAAARQATQVFIETASDHAVETQGEKLYAGVEIKEGRYFLTIDPEDGTSPEVFRSRPIAEGGTQGEVWKLLRDSKKNATRELRRRAKKVQITRELREMAVDVIPYVPLEMKVNLSPAELFEAHAMLADPNTAVEGTRRLQLAARTQEDIDRANEVIERGRMQEQEAAAHKWMRDNPQFIVCDENLKAMMEIMGGLGWGVTNRNMTLAYSALLEQEALITQLPEVAEPEFRTGPEQRPRTVFVPKSPPVESPKAAPAPAARPVSRRPLNGSFVDSRATRMNTAPVKPTAMTALEYHQISAADLKLRYGKDPDFKARVDAYWAAGGR
jgi:hypothetical protein